jgi:hypothetical protein
MAFYLVSATPRSSLMAELSHRLTRNEFAPLQPFGRSLTSALRGARRLPDGRIMWEEEDYCEPPLAQERAAVLDRYFEGLSVEPVIQGTGWALIQDFPPLFPDLA